MIHLRYNKETEGGTKCHTVGKLSFGERLFVSQDRRSFRTKIGGSEICGEGPGPDTLEGP